MPSHFVQRCVLLAMCIGIFTLAQGQHNVYVTQHFKVGEEERNKLVNKENFETTSVVPQVQRIIYTQGQAHLISATGTTIFPVGEVREMSWKERDFARTKIIPPSFAQDFDFNIAFTNDQAWAERSETMPAPEMEKAYEDFVDNSTWSHRIHITFGTGQAQVNGIAEGVKVEVNGQHVIVRSEQEGVEYVLTGKSDNGSFKLYGTRKAKLTLDGVQLTNPTGAAINNQGKKRLFVVLPAGRHNTLTDGKTYTKTAGEDERGCLFSEGQICISGTGSLTVEANSKNGIASDDYIHFISGLVRVNAHGKKGDAVKVKDYFHMGGGALQIYSDAIAGKGVRSDSLIHISGGKLTAILTGDALWDEAEKDYSSACAVKSDFSTQLTGGELHLLVTGDGGKGISAGKTKTENNDLLIDGAKVWVHTAGNAALRYNPDDTAVPDLDVTEEEAQTNPKKVYIPRSLPKGLKAANDLIIGSGQIFVRCSGGTSIPTRDKYGTLRIPERKGGEGIEAKGTLRIKGGTVRSYAFDDGGNAQSAHIEGGDIFLCSTANDGLDVSNLTMSSGSLFIIAARSDLDQGKYSHQAGIDNDGHPFIYNGGQLIAIGGDNNPPITKEGMTPHVLVYLDQETPYLGIVDEAGNHLITVNTPDAYQPICVLLTVPWLQLNKKYKLITFPKLISGEEQEGIIHHPVYETPSTTLEFTPTSSVTTLGERKLWQ